MNQGQPRNKMRMGSVNISKAISVLVALLVLRLFWVQVIEGSRYEEMAMNQTEGRQTLYSPRGTIYDRNGKEMAFSIMVKSLYGDPGMLNVSPQKRLRRWHRFCTKKRKTSRNDSREIRASYGWSARWIRKTRTG